MPDVCIVWYPCVCACDACYGITCMYAVLVVLACVRTCYVMHVSCMLHACVMHSTYVIACMYAVDMCMCAGGTYQHVSYML